MTRFVVFTASWHTSTLVLTVTTAALAGSIILSLLQSIGDRVGYTTLNEQGTTLPGHPTYALMEGIRRPSDAVAHAGRWSAQVRPHTLCDLNTILTLRYANLTYSNIAMERGPLHRRQWAVRPTTSPQSRQTKRGNTWLAFNGMACLTCT
jgi:hypothetical protein